MMILRPQSRKQELTRPECLAGIAVKAVGALRGLMSVGEFDHGESAVAAHQKFARRSNKVLAWMHEEGFADPTSWYPKGDLWKKFRSWDIEESGASRMGRNTFYERVAQVPGMIERRREGRDGFLGFRFHAHVAYGMVLDFTGSDNGGAEDGAKTAPKLPRGSFEPTELPLA